MAGAPVPRQGPLALLDGADGGAYDDGQALRGDTSRGPGSEVIGGGQE
jgi:hypothetical protein